MEARGHNQSFEGLRTRWLEALQLHLDCAEVYRHGEEGGDKQLVAKAILEINEMVLFELADAIDAADTECDEWGPCLEDLVLSYHNIVNVQ